MKYAHYDSNTNKLLGWYDNEIHTTIPTPNLEVSEDVWQESIDNDYNCVDTEKGTLFFKEFRTEEEILEQTKTAKKSQLNAEFKKAVEAIADVLPNEMVSWRDQETEARAYKADNNTQTPVLTALAESRGLGEGVDELATKVIANAEAYRKAYYPLLGKHQQAIKAIDKATTVDELNKVQS